MEKITRKEAKEQGLQSYFTGVPCKHGHIDERRVVNGQCRECSRLLSKSFYHNNNGKEKQRTDAKREIKKRWRQNNKGRVNSWTAKRHASKQQRTPKWLTPDDLWMIEEAYTLASLRTQMTGILWSVDHKIPMQGDTVSGFHTPLNLQVIPQLENSNKSNKWNWDTQQ